MLGRDVISVYCSGLGLPKPPKTVLLQQEKNRIIAKPSEHYHQIDEVFQALCGDNHGLFPESDEFWSNRKGSAKLFFWLVQVQGAILEELSNGIPIIIGLAAVDVEINGPYTSRYNMAISAFCISPFFQKLHYGRQFYNLMKDMCVWWLNTRDWTMLHPEDDINKHDQLQTPTDHVRIVLETTYSLGKTPIDEKTSTEELVNSLTGSIKFWRALGFQTQKVVMSHVFLIKNENVAPHFSPKSITQSFTTWPPVSAAILLSKVTRNKKLIKEVEYRDKKRLAMR